MAAVLVHRRRRTEDVGPELGTDQPPEEKGAGGQQHHHNAEAARHPIGEGLNRRFPGLGTLHQGNDPSHRALAARSQHLELEARLQIQRTRGEFLASSRQQRQRLTGEAGDVQGRLAVQHAAVHGDPIPRQQAQPIPGP